MSAKSRFLAICLVLALSVVVAGGAVAQSPRKGDRWVLLMRAPLTSAPSPYRLDLKAAQGTFRAVRVVVAGRPLTLTRAVIAYGDGSVHDERMSVELRAGERTRPLDVRPTGRFIDRLELHLAGDRQARSGGRLEVWGLQSPAGAMAARPPPLAHTLVAAAGQSGSSRALTLILPPRLAKFRHMKLDLPSGVARGVLTSLTMVYADGVRETVAPDRRADRREVLDWLRVDPSRFVARVEAVTTADVRHAGAGRVRLLAELADGWATPTGEGPKHNAGWVLLSAGEVAAAPLPGSKDLVWAEFPVARGVGRLRRLRITPEPHGVVIAAVELVGSSGTRQKRQTSKPSGTGPVPQTFDVDDVPAGLAVIRIAVSPESRRTPEGSEALVRVWGRY
ncbi:MAG: hypothetical protein KDJ41_20865 [Hyphomicrobiaceae bacterium]|nr:hypothetical protein [Hyphomicrobiaceae bacterium]